MPGIIRMNNLAHVFGDMMAIFLLRCAILAMNMHHGAIILGKIRHKMTDWVFYYPLLIGLSRR